MAALQETSDDLGAATRRGVIFIPMAKLWFLVAGLLMQLLLPRALGSAALFGMWTLVLGWLSVVNNVLIQATIQAVSHFAAAGAEALEDAKRTALQMNLRLGLGVAAAFFLCAPLVAYFEHDAELIPHLRLSAGVILAYSFYAVFVGAANGARQFHKQAALDMTFSTLRTGLVLAAALIFHATLPAVGAFVLAAAVIMLLSIGVVGMPRPGHSPAGSMQRMFSYMAGLMLYMGAINALMFLDGWLLKRLCTEAATHAGSAAAEVKQGVDALVGVYAAAQTVARLPYQLILAVTLIIFPLLSSPTMQADQERWRRYVQTALRYSLVVMVAMVAGLGVRPQATLRLLYPAEYSTGAPALAILLAAYVCFSLLCIVGTITNSLGRVLPTAILGLLTAVLTCGAVYLAIERGLATGEPPLRAAALGLLVGMGLGLALNLAYLWKRIQVTLPPLSLLRAALAFSVVVALGRVWPAAGTPGLLGSKLGTLLCAGLASTLYIAVLLLLRELSLRELLQLRRAPTPG
jgi:O-antigen/teichoic acid export membrane protein